MVHGDTVTGADTAGELLAVLIPGYDEIADDDAGHDEALWRRYESAVATAGELPETLLRPPRCTVTSTRPAPAFTSQAHAIGG